MLLLYVIFSDHTHLRFVHFIYLMTKYIIGPRREKTCLRGFANNKCADQPAHPRRLISAFVIRLSRCIISRLATSEISIF